VKSHGYFNIDDTVLLFLRETVTTEKRDALQRWADHVDALVSGRKGAVVTLRGRT